MSDIAKDNNNRNESSNSNKDDCRLIHGDFMEIAKNEIQDNYIDLILTDPPYGFDALPIYEGLAWLADRVLKPGGSLVFCVGQVMLEKVMQIIGDNTDNQAYWWIFCVRHSRYHSRNMQDTYLQNGSLCYGMSKEVDLTNMQPLVQWVTL